MVYFYGINLSQLQLDLLLLFGFSHQTTMLITIYLNEAMIKMVENMEIAVKQLQRYYEIILFMALLRGCAPN
jgi:hypothetical protein